MSDVSGTLRRLVGRISRLEWSAAAIAAATLAVLVALEPDILEAPFASGRAVAFTFGGTALAAVVLAVMLALRVHPVARLLVLAVPFLAVNWWLLEPYFVDDVVNDEFATSIAEQREPATPTTSEPALAGDMSTPPADPAPVLLGAGQFEGLAGHDGRGDAGVFQLADGNQVVRFENFDIENGPDLEVYVVPGADRRSLDDGAVHLGSLRGNVGDQTYELPEPLAPGPWTVLVWCEAFSVEFVAATVTVA